MCEIVAGFVEKAVAETGTEEYAEECVDEECVEFLHVTPAAPISQIDDVDGDGESDEPKDAVPTEGEAADGEYYRVRMPVDVG